VRCIQRICDVNVRCSAGEGRSPGTSYASSSPSEHSAMFSTPAPCSRPVTPPNLQRNFARRPAPFLRLLSAPPCSATRMARVALWLSLTFCTLPSSLQPLICSPPILWGAHLQMTTTSRDTASNFSKGTRGPERPRMRPGPGPGPEAGAAGLRGSCEMVRASGIKLSASGELCQVLCVCVRVCHSACACVCVFGAHHTIMLY
jgi:hypothetical protein